MEQEKKVLELNVEDVLPNRFQPRISFEEDKINDLSNSIKEHGVIQPIVVRPIADKYEIIAGERRYKATVMAGIQKIPAIVVDLNDRDSAEIALIENVQRQDLTPIEEAVSYKKILDMGYISQDQLAKKLGKSQAAIANKLRLLNLNEEVQEALLHNQISERHARSLLKLSSSDQSKLLKKIIDERLTVRKTDDEISKMLNNTDISPDTRDLQNNQIDTSKLERLDFDLGDYKKEAETMNDNNTAPGFVNVDEIEKNAQDIFQPKPTISAEDFLKPSDIPPAPEKIIPVDDTPITTGKFFGALGDNNVEEVITPTPTIETTPTAEVIQNTEVAPEVTIPVAPVVEDEPIATTIPDYSFLNTPASIEVSTPEETSVTQDAPIADTAIKASNVSSAISAIRSCADTIRSMGFNVDLDEFDLENMYQVVFKVHKTDK